MHVFSNKAFISGGGETDVYVVMVRTGEQGMYLTNQLACVAWVSNQVIAWKLQQEQKKRKRRLAQKCLLHRLQINNNYFLWSSSPIYACQVPIPFFFCAFDISFFQNLIKINFLLLTSFILSGPKGISTLVVEKGTPGLSFGKKERKVM